MKRNREKRIKIKTAKREEEMSPFRTILADKTERINELKGQNAELLLLLETYRKREKEIVDALAFAKQKAEEYVREAKVKYALECERLKLYRAKWTKCVENDSLNKNLQRTLTTLRDCQLEMEAMLASDLGENFKAYLSERNRLSDEPSLDYQAIVKPAKKADEDMLTDEELNELLEQLQ